MRWSEVAESLIEIHLFGSDKTNPVGTWIQGNRIISRIDNHALDLNAASLSGLNLLHVSYLYAIQISAPAESGAVGGVFAVLSRNINAIASESCLQIRQSDVDIR